jgi:hypothetical protein
MVGEFYFLPFRPLIPFALMGFASGSYFSLIISQQHATVKLLPLRHYLYGNFAMY